MTLRLSILSLGVALALVPAYSTTITSQDITALRPETAAFPSLDLEFVATAAEASDTDSNFSTASPIPYVRVAIPSGVTALGTDLFTTNRALSYAVAVAGNHYTPATFDQTTLPFWGIASDRNIDLRQLALAGAADDSSSPDTIGSVAGEVIPKGPPFSEAPEAGTYLLIGSGLIGLVILSKLMKPAATNAP